MRVVINNKVGVFHFTKKQAEWLFNKAMIQSVISPFIGDIIDSFGDGHGNFANSKDFYLHHTDWEVNEYKYRSHPWIVEVCTLFPDKSQKIDEIEGDYYRIIEEDDGTEYIITPCLDDFIQGFLIF